MVTRRRSSAQIAGAAILFGLVPLIVKASPLSSVQLAAGRLLVATGVLFAWRLWQRKQDATLRDCWRSAPLLLLLFGILHGSTILSSFFAIKLINAAVAAALLYAGAVYLVALSILLLRERPQPGAIFGLVVAVAGVATLCWPGHGAGLARSSWGYWLGALSGVLMAAVYLLGKVLARRQDRLDMALLQQIVALPLIVPLLLFEQSWSLDWAALAVLLALGGVCTAFPFVLLYGALRQTSGQRAGVLLLLELATPIVLGPWLLGELPTTLEGLGAGLIVVGCTLAAFAKISPNSN